MLSIYTTGDKLVKMLLHDLLHFRFQQPEVYCFSSI